VGDAQLRAVNPSDSQSGAHALLLRMLLRGLKNFLIRQVAALRFCEFWGQRGAASPRSGAEGFSWPSMQCFTTVSTASALAIRHELHRPYVRQDKQLQRLHDAEAVFVVGAHHPTWVARRWKSARKLPWEAGKDRSAHTNGSQIQVIRAGLQAKDDEYY